MDLADDPFFLWVHTYEPTLYGSRRAIPPPVKRRLRALGYLQ